MQLLVLGGYGEMGRVVVHHLLQHDDVDEVVVADKSQRSVFESPAVTHESVDLRDRDELADCLGGYNLVANCAPFEFNAPVTEAAIEVGTDVIDLGSYDRDVVEAQLALDGRARESGVTVVPGLGVSPGLSNVLVRYAADRLETVDEVHVRWCSQRPLTASPGLLATALVEPLHERTTYRDGEWQTEQTPFDGEESVSFGEWGTETCVSVPHPEPLTVPRFVDVDTVTVKGGWGESTALLRSLTDLGLVRETPEIRGIPPREYVTDFLVETYDRSVESRFALSVTVTGTVGHSDVELSFDLPAVTEDNCEAYPMSVIPVGVATGVPAAVGSALLAAGQATSPGVHPPESAFSADEFLDEVTNHLEVHTMRRETRAL